MKMRRVGPGAGMVVLGISALLVVAAGADGERTLSIRAVMHKQYTVSNSPFVRIKKELSAAAPDWERVWEETRKFVSLAAVLDKNDPPSGEKGSWKKFTGQQFGDAKAMVDAAEARDKEAVLVAHKRLAASCKACHNAHKFQGRD
jgi:cytochrome c556